MESVVPIETGPPQNTHLTGENDISEHFEEFFRENDHLQPEIYSDLPPINERKQALERQLQTRRDPETLQSHGILPPSNMPSAYYYETRHLEKARTVDFLKKKITQRPERQTLVEYHILPEHNVSPLIIEPQKKLQKAQLAHRLSEKISVRPGPLELIQKGIIEPDNLQLTNNIRNGKVHYDPVDQVSYNINNQNFVFSSAENSPQNSLNSPTSSLQQLANEEARSVADIKRDFESKHQATISSRPPSRAESSCVSFRNRNNAGQRIKKAKRQRIKFHEYNPMVATGSKRRDNCNNANNKNIMQNYENRMKQQSVLLQEMDRLQSHLELNVIPQQRCMTPQPVVAGFSDNGQTNAAEAKFRENFRKEIKSGPVMIAPSPVPTGDKMMVDIEQRLAASSSTRHQSRPVCRVEKLVKKFENCQTPPNVPPPIHFKAPPTPPPVEQLERSQAILKFEPERVSMYKVRELKAILRENNLTVSGTKEALIERLMQHHQSDKPKQVPGKLKNVKFEPADTNRIEKMRLEMDAMRRLIDEKNKTIEQLTAGNFGVPLELASSSETITSEISNQTGLVSHSFSPTSSVPSTNSSDFMFHSKSPSDRKLFSSPSAPTLMTTGNGLDEIYEPSYPTQAQSQAMISSKYSDRDSGVNSQENLSDVMDRDHSSFHNLDWLNMDPPTATSRGDSDQMDCSGPFVSGSAELDDLFQLDDSVLFTQPS